MINQGQYDLIQQQYKEQQIQQNDQTNEIEQIEEQEEEPQKKKKGLLYIVQQINKNQNNQAEFDKYNIMLIKKYFKDTGNEINYNISSDQISKNDQILISKYLIERNCIIPRYWMQKLIANDVENLRKIANNHYSPFPQNWVDMNQMTIFDKAYFGIVPDISGHSPDEQDEQGFTVAMLLVLNDIDVPKEWQHDPQLKIKGTKKVIFELFANNNVNPPQWTYLNVDQRNKNKNTQAMILAHKGLDIPKELYHNPELQNKKGLTVAMILAKNNIFPPQEWWHSDKVKSKNGETLSQLIKQIKQK